MDNITPETKQQVEGFILAGQKIQAIKALREATGCDLMTAKQVVEGYESHLRQESPDKFAPKGKGCMGSIAVALALGAALLAWAL